MTPDFLPLLAMVILLFPMGYLLIASPSFLLVRLSIPVVAQLLRGMFNGYFLMLVIASGLAAALFAVTAHPAVATGLALAAGLAFATRRWFLRQMDIARTADAEGAIAASAARRLRHLHVGGMLLNLLQVAAIVAAISHIA